MPALYENCEECKSYYTHRDSLYIRIGDGSKSPKFSRIGFFCYDCAMPVIDEHLVGEAIFKAQKARGY